MASSTLSHKVRDTLHSVHDQLADRDPASQPHAPDVDPSRSGADHVDTDRALGDLGRAAANESFISPQTAPELGPPTHESPAQARDDSQHPTRVADQTEEAARRAGLDPGPEMGYAIAGGNAGSEAAGHAHKAPLKGKVGEREENRLKEATEVTLKEAMGEPQGSGLPGDPLHVSDPASAAAAPAPTVAGGLTPDPMSSKSRPATGATAGTATSSTGGGGAKPGGSASASASAASPPAALDPAKVRLEMLLVNGNRRAFDFEPGTSIAQVRAHLWDAWPQGE